MTITLILFSLFSLTANILLFWYVRRLLQKLYLFSEDIEDVNDSLDEFAQHLEKIHAQETYYGDQTLQNLIKHSQDIVKEISEFKDLYLVGTDEEGIELNAAAEEQEIE